MRRKESDEKIRACEGVLPPETHQTRDRSCRTFESFFIPFYADVQPYRSNVEESTSSVRSARYPSMLTEAADSRPLCLRVVKERTPDRHSLMFSSWLTFPSHLRGSQIAFQASPSIKTRFFYLTNGSNFREIVSSQTPKLLASRISSLNPNRWIGNVQSSLGGSDPVASPE